MTLGTLTPAKSTFSLLICTGLSNMTVIQSPDFQLEGTSKDLVTISLELLDVCKNALYEPPAVAGMRRKPCTYTDLPSERSASEGNLLKSVISLGTGYPWNATLILVEVGL